MTDAARGGGGLGQALMLVPPEREPSHPTPGPLRRALFRSVVVISGTALGYRLSGHTLVVAGRPPRPALTSCRFPPPCSHVICRF